MSRPPVPRTMERLLGRSVAVATVGVATAVERQRPPRRGFKNPRVVASEPSLPDDTFLVGGADLANYTDETFDLPTGHLWLVEIDASWIDIDDVGYDAEQNLMRSDLSVLVYGAIPGYGQSSSVLLTRTLPNVRSHPKLTTTSRGPFTVSVAAFAWPFQTGLGSPTCAVGYRATWLRPELDTDPELYVG